jgi:Holliday junction resolvase RusA-like endonuclease
MRSITFDVDGVPVPQGSKTCLCRNGKPLMFEQAKGFSQWRTAVKRESHKHAPSWTRDTPLVVEMIFSFPYTGRVRTAEWKITKPDIDKLIRHVLDGLTFDARGRGVLPDDAQVVRLVVDKVYGPVPGVRIRVTDAPSIYTPLPLPE